MVCKHWLHIWAFLFVLASAYCNTDYFAYVTNTLDDTVSVIDAETNTIVDSLPVTDEGLGYVAFSPNGDFAYVTQNSTGNVFVFETQMNTQIDTISFGLGSGVQGVAANPNGSFIYVVDQVNGAVYVVNIPQNTLDTTINVPGTSSPVAIAVTPNGNFAYVSGGNGGVSVINTRTNTVTTTVLTTGHNSHGIVASPSGDFVYVNSLNSLGNPVVYVIATATNTVVNTILINSQVVPTGAGIDVTPDGAALYAVWGDTAMTSNDHGVAVIALAANGFTANSITLVHFTLADGSTSSNVAVSPKGDVAYVTNSTAGSGMNSGSILVIDTTTLLFTPISNNEGGPFGVAFNPNYPRPVNDLQGKQAKNDFGLEYELFNTIEWEPSFFMPDGYFVYRDGVRIATLDANTFHYRDHNRKKGIATLYTVTSFLSPNLESIPKSITIN